MWVLAILQENVHPCTTVRFPHTQGFFDEGVSLNYSHSAYVDSKVTVGMVLHSGLIKDDKSKYTKTILDFISFVDGIPDFLPKHY